MKVGVEAAVVATVASNAVIEAKATLRRESDKTRLKTVSSQNRRGMRLNTTRVAGAESTQSIISLRRITTNATAIEATQATIMSPLPRKEGNCRKRATAVSTNKPTIAGEAMLTTKTTSGAAIEGRRKLIAAPSRPSRTTPTTLKREGHVPQRGTKAVPIPRQEMTEAVVGTPVHQSTLRTRTSLPPTTKAGATTTPNSSSRPKTPEIRPQTTIREATRTIVIGTETGTVTAIGTTIETEIATEIATTTTTVTTRPRTVTITTTEVRDLRALAGVTITSGRAGATVALRPTRIRLAPTATCAAEVTPGKGTTTPQAGQIVARIRANSRLSSIIRRATIKRAAHPTRRNPAATPCTVAISRATIAMARGTTTTRPDGTAGAGTTVVSAARARLSHHPTSSATEARLVLMVTNGITTTTITAARTTTTQATKVA